MRASCIYSGAYEKVLYEVLGDEGREPPDRQRGRLRLAGNCKAGEEGYFLSMSLGIYLGGPEFISQLWSNRALFQYPHPYIRRAEPHASP